MQQGRYLPGLALVQNGFTEQLRFEGDLEFGDALYALDRQITKTAIAGNVCGLGSPWRYRAKARCNEEKWAGN